MEDALRALSADPEVEFAEPNWIYSAQATPNDPQYTNGNLWGMYGDTTTPRNEFGSQAAEAWPQDPSCNNVYVAVMDGGIMRNHYDLWPNMWVNPFDPVDGLDNDGNGYVDDRFGWNAVRNNGRVYEGPTEGSRHGTHVAGTIAAVGGNGRGVAGVCWSGVKIIPLRVLRADGTGYAVFVERAVDYLLALRQRLPVVVVNMSISGPASPTVADSMRVLHSAGILVVAAAGNGRVVIKPDGTRRGIDLDNPPIPKEAGGYPARLPYDNILSVGAINRRGGRAVYSNFGRISVDIAAPGTNIMSTVPDLTSGAATVGLATGTSMAAPHVSGAAALYYARRGAVDYRQVRRAILEGAIPTPSWEGRAVTSGRLDITGMLAR